MKITLLAGALAAAMTLACGVSVAQPAAVASGSSAQGEAAASASAQDERRSRRSSKSDDKSKEPALYPNATRVAPKLDLTSQKDQKNLSEGLDAVNAGDKEKAEGLLQPLIDHSKSKYAQALALQGLANLKYNDGDTKGAITTLQRSLEIGVMPNDAYFQLMYMLAQFQIADEQYQAGLDTLTKWRNEGKKETAESYALEGSAEYRLDKYPEAIAAIKKAQALSDKPDPVWNQILMASYAQTGQTDEAAQLAQKQLDANPGDATAMGNAVAVLMQAHQYPQAIAMMEKARAAGSLGTEGNYINLAKLYLISGQESGDAKPNAQKATQVLDEGVSKGVITATADNFMLRGQAAELADDVTKAVGYYDQSTAVAKDGEAALRAGQLLMTENKYSQAKTRIQQAIDRGVAHKGTAYMLLAQAERGLKNKPAAIAAMKLAAQQPETAAKANTWLKQAGSGK